MNGPRSVFLGSFQTTERCLSSCGDSSQSDMDTHSVLQPLSFLAVLWLPEALCLQMCLFIRVTKTIEYAGQVFTPPI